MLYCTTGDNAIRWQSGQRLEHLFEQRCDLTPTTPAVETEHETLTFAELDQRANRLARFLRRQGLGAGERIALLFDKGADAYVAMLAVLKIGAVYVPLDGGFPRERLAYIVQDASATTILSMTAFAANVAGLAARVILLDATAGKIVRELPTRLSASECCDSAVTDLCYVIYTSGTTGNPKGVAVEHASICNFVRVAADVYQYRPSDRVYQGMTIAFDFSVEELWVPLLAGATLIPARPGISLVGSDLADFLIERRVTAWCCVPTLLATIDKDLPDLRFLLVSGEACPQSLVKRWHKPGRLMLNAYGPTEATVTATVTQLAPDKAVTIGGPLPTYAIVILDEAGTREMPDGEAGEIGIAGIGLAVGYLNRPDLTADKFISDRIGIANNPSGRIYRTGDLGRINADGEIEYQGRIDTQVKIRGYRIELAEIETLLEQQPAIAQAVVQPFESSPGLTELVAYYTLRHGHEAPDPSQLLAMLRKQLPPYMLPAFYEPVAAIPMTASNKADRKALPPPAGPRHAPGGKRHVAPRTEIETLLADTLAKVMRIAPPSVEDDFFADLGAHSLLMARYCAALRHERDLGTISMRDIYQNPSVRKLASRVISLEDRIRAPLQREAPHAASRLSYLACGAGQLGVYLLLGLIDCWLLQAGYRWTADALGDPVQAYLRAVAFVVYAAALLTVLPTAAKWLLIGRFKPGRLPVWSLAYLRFWTVRTLIQNAPPVLFAGSPVYTLYLRMLGMKLGRNALVLSANVPVCTDLISIGADAVVSEEAMLAGYHAQSGWIRMAPVRIGQGAFVGHGSILDIDTVLPDEAQLGHSSSLQEGQHLRPGSNYHGSPAQPTKAVYRPMATGAVAPWRATAFAAAELTAVLGGVAPAVWLGGCYGFGAIGWLLGDMMPETAHGWGVLGLETLCLTAAVYVGLLVLGLLVAALASRGLGSLLRPGKAYPVYGLHYGGYRLVHALSNAFAYNKLLGDSSWITAYLQWIGYRLRPLVQTGSNFGVDQRHDLATLCDVGTGTMTSDGLRFLNAVTSSSHFQLRPVRVGAHSYLGNFVRLPADAKVGANCLYGTKVLVPVDGAPRENVGLLGSPAFEIPRAVNQDLALRIDIHDVSFCGRLKAKNADNLRTMALYLLRDWLLLTALALTAALVIGALGGEAHPFSLLAALTVDVVVLVLGLALAERASLGFRRLRPVATSIYDRAFWRHERHWKLSAQPLTYLFRGTPFRSLVHRLLGIGVGAMLFDDGAGTNERTLISIGDHVTLNQGCQLWGHSLEEGVFKSDTVAIGDGCSIGPGAFVHYGVTLGERVLIDADSFVMKGETAEADSRWRGNPARIVSSDVLARGVGVSVMPDLNAESEEAVATREAA